MIIHEDFQTSLVLIFLSSFNQFPWYIGFGISLGDGVTLSKGPFNKECELIDVGDVVFPEFNDLFWRHLLFGLGISAIYKNILAIFLVARHDRYEAFFLTLTNVFHLSLLNFLHISKTPIFWFTRP